MQVRLPRWFIYWFTANAWVRLIKYETSSSSNNLFYSCWVLEKEKQSVYFYLFSCLNLQRSLFQLFFSAISSRGFSFPDTKLDSLGSHSGTAVLFGRYSTADPIRCSSVPLLINLWLCWLLKVPFKRMPNRKQGCLGGIEMAGILHRYNKA